MPAYWEGLPPATNDVATSVVGTAERALGLLAEEAALRRNKSLPPAANRRPRSGARDEAATAVETASKGQGDRPRRSSRRSSRGSTRKGRPSPGRGHRQEQEQQGRDGEL
jgi:hypothetical protein